MCVLQPQKVVILLTGRYAGKKAVIVRSYDEGTSGRKYGHAVVCGLSKEPRKVVIFLLTAQYMQIYKCSEHLWSAGYQEVVTEGAKEKV